MTAKWLLLPVTFFLATTTTPAQTSPGAAPGGAAPGDSSREMQEDVAVFRVLFSRALARHYGLPVSEKSPSNVPHHAHPTIHHPGHQATPRLRLRIVGRPRHEDGQQVGADDVLLPAPRQQTPVPLRQPHVPAHTHHHPEVMALSDPPTKRKRRV